MPGSLSTRGFFLPGPVEKQWVDKTPNIVGMKFPRADYWARGVPQCKPAKFTTYGYKLSIVRGQDGKLTQLPRPSDPSSTRPRSDACLIRPQRSLSVQQILAGEYFCRPDPEAFQRLYLQQQQPAAKQTHPPATRTALPPIDQRTGTIAFASSASLANTAPAGAPTYSASAIMEGVES